MDIKKAEEMGLVADSMEIRLTLMKDLESGKKTLEQIQKELKDIQKNAHKKGFYTRNDIITNKVINFEDIKNIEIRKEFNKLNKKIKINNKQVSQKKI